MKLQLLLIALFAHCISSENAIKMNSVKDAKIAPLKERIHVNIKLNNRVLTKPNMKYPSFIEGQVIISDGDSLEINVEIDSPIQKLIQKDVVIKAGSRLIRNTLNEVQNGLSGTIKISGLNGSGLIKLVVVTEEHKLSWELGKLFVGSSISPSEMPVRFSKENNRIATRDYPIYLFLMGFGALVGLFTTSVSKIGMKLVPVGNSVLWSILLQVSIISGFAYLIYSWIKLDLMNTLLGMLIPCSYTILIGFVALK